MPSGSSSTLSSSPPPSSTAQHTTEARAAVLATLNSAGAYVDHETRTRTADLHANSTAIAKQEAELAKQTAALGKETDKWEKLLSNGTKKLNEVGDIQNWAELIERDLLVLEETVRLAEGGVERDGESASGTGGREGRLGK